MVRLGGICENKIATVPRTYNGLIDYIDISSIDNLKKEVISWKTIHASEAPSRARQLVCHNDVLVSTVRPNLNAVAILSKDMTNLAVASTGYCVLRCNANVDPRYVFYYCMSKGFINRLVKIARGASYPAVSDNDIKGCEIPLPFNREQHKIVAMLDAVADLLKMRKQQLAELDKLVKSRFVEMYALWEKDFTPIPLGNVLQQITYGFTNPMPDAENGPWKVTAKDIVAGHIDFGTARKTTQEAFDGLTDKSRPILRDVLLTKDGTLGRVAIVEQENICINQSVALLRCNEKILPEFLTSLLQMPDYQNRMLEDSGGVTIKHLYITKVDKIPIIVPNM